MNSQKALSGKADYWPERLDYATILKKKKKVPQKEKELQTLTTKVKRASLPPREKRKVKASLISKEETSSFWKSWEKLQGEL